MRPGLAFALGGAVAASAFVLSVRSGLLPDAQSNAPARGAQRERSAPPAISAPLGVPEPGIPSAEPSVPVSAADPQGALQRLFAQRPSGATEDPSILVNKILDQMDDAQLRAAISQLTNLQPSDLEDIRDLRDYARRLVGIGISGVFARRPPEPPGTPVPTVLFSKSVEEFGAPTEMLSRFDGAPNDRIYAVFPTEAYTSDKVLVKWYRDAEPNSLLYEFVTNGQSRMLVFGRYSVHPGDPLSHVWLAREGNWERGDYVVEFYDPSEPLAKLAEGRFVVSTEPEPKPAE